MPGTTAPPALRWCGVPVLDDGAGDPVHLRAERPHQLLALLACRRGWVARDALATAFWPDHAPDAARRNLRKVLLVAERTARRLPGAAIERQADRLRWQPESDLTRLDAAAAAERHGEVLALYAPPLFDGLDDGLAPDALDWLDFERQRIETLWRRSVAARLDALASDPAAAAALAEAVLAIDPLDESALLALGTACIALDQTARARHAVRVHADRLRVAFGVEPTSSLRALSARLDRGPPTRAVPAAVAPADTPLPSGATAPVPSGPPLSRPPAASAGFVGRRLEVAQLLRLLDEDACRVLTVTGPGGCGKTSLLRAAFDALGRRYADRAWWVALDDLVDVAEVPTRVAGAIGLPAQSADDAWQSIAAHLAPAPALLVVDNAEHLDGFAAALAALLATAPGAKAVVASRSRLRVPGEWLLPLDGLPLPDRDETACEVLRHNDAVRLFENRALAVSPGFDLAAHAADVVRLLHQVEALPLALELAAAWTRLLPVAEIADELERSLELLEPAASPASTQLDEAPGAGRHRQRGMRSSFAWSWRSLGAVERAALVRLALLPGAFERGMAAQVADAPLPVIAALVDRSLVRADGAGRFSLHPLLRQFAAERKDAPVDAATVARRHAGWVTRWLARYDDPARYDVREMVAALDRELAHVRAAWRWAVAERAPELVEQGAAVILRWFESRGAWADGSALMESAVAAFDDSGDSDDSDGGDASDASDAADGSRRAGRRALLAALGAWAQLSVRRGRFVEGEATARRALALAAAIGHRNGLKSSANLVGMALYRQGRMAEAAEFFRQVLGHAREDGETLRVAMLCSNLAVAETALGRHAEAVALHLESAGIARAAGNTASLAAALNNLSTTRLALGDWAGAEAAADEAYGIYTAAGLRSRQPLALLNRAEAQLEQGDLDGADRSAAAALRLAVEGAAEPDTQIEAMLTSARVAIARAVAAGTSAAAARSHLRGALSLATAVEADASFEKILLVHAERVLCDGHVDDARALGAALLARPGADPMQASRWRRRMATLPASARDAAPVGGPPTDLAAAIADLRRELADPPPGRAPPP